jgi:RNA polymerase sigma-70 factor, ECF subfamily
VIADPAVGHGYGRMTTWCAEHPRQSAKMNEVTLANDAKGHQARDGGLSLSPADGARYQTIVTDHFDVVWRTLRGLGVPPGAIDDAAQQVFLVALQKLGAIVEGSERSFVLGTAVGVAANARRSVARNPEIADPDAIGAYVDPHPDPERAAVTSQRQAIVQVVLDGMPDDLRAVFVLFELEGFTTIAIGEMLGIPTGTASSRLRRAREQFQSDVQRVMKMKPRPHAISVRPS